MTQLTNFRTMLANIPIKFVIPLALAFATFFSPQSAQAQAPVNVYMTDNGGNFYYAMTDLTWTNILGVNVLSGVGTDGVEQQGVVVVPTQTPNKFLYFIAGDATLGGPAGTIGVFSINATSPLITWENTAGLIGFAALF